MRMAERSVTGRMTWERLPLELRDAIADRCGAGIVSPSLALGGFSPGFAGVVTLTDGRRLFLKAGDAATNAETGVLYRREADVAGVLPPETAPTLHWWFKAGGWVVLAFDVVAGVHPGAPWTETELDAVLAAQRRLSETPPPVGLRRLDAFFDDLCTGWRRLTDERHDDLPPAADRWLISGPMLERRAAIALAQGESVVHLDLRSDNILLTPSGVRFIDWPHAGVGCPWADLVFFASTVTLEGGPAPGEVVVRTDVADRARSEDFLAGVVAWAGRVLWRSRQSSPPGIPHLRSFQAAQAEVALAWAADLADG